jgi:DNA-binding Xre family transcriptional regulator
MDVKEPFNLTSQNIPQYGAYCQAQNASHCEIFPCAMYKNGLDYPGVEHAMVHLRIDELLESRGRTAYWLAIEGGITHSTVYKLRHGKMKTLSLELIESLCRTLACTPNDLIEISDAKPEPKRKSKAKG